MGQNMDLHATLAALKDSLYDAGFDLFQPFPTPLYNSSRPSTCPDLQTFSRATPVSVLVGNTRHLWPKFIADQGKAQQHGSNGSPPPSDPLDEYTERTVVAALRASGADGPTSQISFVHTPPGRPGFVAAAHAAHVSGLAYSSEATHLALHPEFGPWFALRAVFSFDADWPSDDLPPPASPLADPIPATEMPRIAEMRSQLDPSTYGPDWRSWLAFREAVGEAVGARREHRYPDDMIAYHYTNNVSLLHRVSSD